MLGVIICDLDGTIYFGERGFAPGLPETYQKLKTNGWVPTINTARHARTGRALAAELGLEYPYACLTGGVILKPPIWTKDDFDLPSLPKTDEILQVRRMSKKLVVDAFQLAESLGLRGRVFYDRDVYLYGEQELYVKWPEDLAFLSLAEVQDGALQMFITGTDHEKGEQVANLLEKMSDEFSYYVFHQRDGFEIAINPKGVTKATLVDFYMQAYQIPREHIMAIGDSPGDIPMLQRAGIGVATALAPEHVKAAADIVLKSASEDAVPVFLQNYYHL